MGIKGIYKEIGAGRRISLCKLAVENLEQTGRPLRLAIDISIWQFQVQAARGGANPAIRTLFYRLVRLLGHSIQPIFVFDGPNKPAFKRNKRTGRNGDVVATAMAKRLIRLFGFRIHDAPGEAEAECALLQQKGIVDAVLSEDVDTIMFGCTRTLRSWSADGTKGSKTPTHVSMYDTEELGQAETGLDREGMVLVALMSGGDYIPEGVPGCGVKVACEAARAGFGKSICRLKKSETRAIAEWRESLIHELRSNESGFFRTRHKALAIPDSFPNLDILRYYTHPVVSSAAAIEALGQESPVKRPVDIGGLREFVRETFDWTFRIGAVKFIRVMAPSMLVQKLLALHAENETRPADLGLIQRIEEGVVKAISNRRSHFSTDATPELRLSYVPASVVGLDLEKESGEAVAASGREGLALNSDDEFDEQVENELEEDAPRAAAKKVFNPLQPEAVWVPESIVKLGVPLTVEDWEEKQREKERARLEAKTPKRRTKKTGLPEGALDSWVRVTKNVGPAERQEVLGSLAKALAPPPSLPCQRPPAEVSRQSLSSTQPAKRAPKPPPGPFATTTSKQKSKPPKKGTNAAAAAQPTMQTNPWTLAAGSQLSPRVPAESYSGVHRPSAIVISSSPSGPPSPPPRSPVRRLRTPAPALVENSLDEDPFASSPPLALQSSPPVKLRLPFADTRVTRESQHDKPGGRRSAQNRGPPPSSQTSIKAFGTVTKSNIPTSTKPRSDDAPAEMGSAGVEQRGRLVSKHVEVIALDDSSCVDINSDPFAPSSSAGRAEDGEGREECWPERKGCGPSLDVERKSWTKIYVPRTSDAGFFREIEVSREQADRIMAEQSRRVGPGGKPSMYRQSNVSILDLTGED